MTGLLNDLMHERADSIGDPQLDLASITRAAERRVRGRRTAWAGGVAASALLATAIGSAILPGDGASDRGERIADGTDEAPVALAWVTGRTLHRAGEPDADLGSPVRSWLWAGRTAAFVDTDRHVRVWDGSASDPLGSIVPVESDNGSRELVADGSRVAWADAEDGFTVHDVATGDGQSIPAQGAEPQVTALDGEVLYAVDGRGVLAWHLDTDVVEVLDPDPSKLVLDAEAGTIAQATGSRKARVTGPGRDLTLAVDDFANLSPDGALVMAESDDEGVLVDTATADRLDIDHGHEWGLPFQWLDDDSVAMLAFDGVQGEGRDLKGYLLRCSVRDGSCETPGQPMTGELGSWQLPVGIHFTD